MPQGRGCRAFQEQHLQRNLKKILLITVKNTLASYSKNRVLQGPDPEIKKEKTLLLRETTAQLSRLRSGFARQLKSYISRISEDVQDKCSECGSTPHDTAHLFACTANPTALTPLDLWKNPQRCSIFLKLLPEGWDEESVPAEDPG